MRDYALGAVLGAALIVSAWVGARGLLRRKPETAEDLGYCGARNRQEAHRWPDEVAGPSWCIGVLEDCRHCEDGHGDPTTRPWGVFVHPARDGDKQPMYLAVCPTNGAHVAESDAAWLRDLIRRHGSIPEEAEAREANRQRMRDHAATAPRDADGRWIP